MKCPTCEFENRENAKFCKECGNRIELVCPHCANSYSPGTKFCDQCGHPFLKTENHFFIDRSRPRSYTPKHLAEKILTSRSAIEGERKLVTVLFADVANFTAFSEGLDPEDVHWIMDGCFRILMDEIHKYEGTINQFTGDGIMAIFGAPIALESHANQACRAALSIKERLANYGEKVSKDYGVEFKMRMGINSGMVIVGAIGNDLRMDYTADGDTTNLASRMESLAQAGTIYVSSNTQHFVSDFFDLKPLGKFEVKGKAKPQEVFELIKAGNIVTRIEAAAAKGLTDFVGREEPMAVLIKAYERSRNGAAQIVEIVGEAGVGKSRLILEFRKRISTERSTCLEGRCAHYGSGMPYLPILDMLRFFFAIEEGERESTVRQRLIEKVLKLDDKLTDALPPLLDLLSLNVEDSAYLSLEPKQRKERIFKGLRDLFIRISQEKHLVFFIDDLHWIDTATEDFLGFLIDSMANEGLMLVMSHRPEYVHQWKDGSSFTKIFLTQLTPKSSTRLVRAIFGGEETAQKLNDIILSRTAGNPFFIEELIRTLLGDGSIRRNEGQYVLAGDPAQLQIPDTVLGVIAARIDRLDEPSKSVLQVASVIGRNFVFRVLEQALVNLRERLKFDLLKLQHLEFIYEKCLFPELEYIFKHALTREVAYNSLLLTKRKDIHSRIGQIIEELYADRLEEFYGILAFHYNQSEDIEKAYRYLRLSGDKAYSRYANWEAFRFYREAILICKKLPQTDAVKREIIETRLRLFPPANFLGFPEDALQLFEEGVDESLKLGEIRKAAEFEARLASAYAFKGELSLASQHGERSFEQAEKNSDVDLMAEAVRDLCAVYSIRGDYNKLLSLTYKVIPLLEKDNLKNSYGRRGASHGRLCCWSGVALGYLGRFEEGISLCEKARLTALSNDHGRGVSFSEMMMGFIFNTKGDGDSAISHLQFAHDFYNKINAALMLGMTWANLGYALMLTGDLQSGRDHAERALEVHKKSGIPYYLPWIHFILGECNMRLSEIEKAHSHSIESLKFARLYECRHLEGQALMLIGRAHALLDDSKLKKTEDYLHQSIDIFREIDTRPSCAVAHLYLGLSYKEKGETEKAMSHLMNAADMFRMMGMKHWLCFARDQGENL